MSKKLSKSARSRSREFVVQALYQFLVGKDDLAGIDEFTRNLRGFNKCDLEHYEKLFFGCASTSKDLDEIIKQKLDRDLSEVSPIERACLWIGTYEFKNCLEIPWRVVLNEAIELCKNFGATDGYKYVNGILHSVAQRFRKSEVEFYLKD